jgi:hypothetical protein
VNGVIATVVLGIVVVSIVAAALTFGSRKSREPELKLEPDPAPRFPESEPAMRGATVAAVAPTAAGAFRAVSAPAEPSTEAEPSTKADNVEQLSTPAKERRRMSNNGARRFAQSGNNVRTIRSIQTR